MDRIVLEEPPQAGPSGTRHDAPTARSSPLTEPSMQSSRELVLKQAAPTTDVVGHIYYDPSGYISDALVP